MSTDDYTIPDGYKCCSKGINCANPSGPVLPATTEYFGNLSSSKDGFMHQCRVCRRQYYLNRQEHYKAATKKRYWDDPAAAREYFRQHYQENAERIKARVRDYVRRNEDIVKAKAKIRRSTERHKANKRRSYLRHKDSILVRQKVYRDANKDKIYKRDKRYRESNKEKLAQSKVDWRENNRTKVKAIQHRYRVNQLNADGYWTDTDIVELYDLQDGRCGYCGIPITFDIPGDVHIDHMQPLSRGGSNWPENLCLACRSCNLAKGNKTPAEWLG